MKIAVIGIHLPSVRGCTCGEGACSRDDLAADADITDAPRSKVGAGLPAMTAWQPTTIPLMPKLRKYLGYLNGKPYLTSTSATPPLSRWRSVPASSTHPDRR